MHALPGASEHERERQADVARAADDADVDISLRHNLRHPA